VPGDDGAFARSAVRVEWIEENARTEEAGTVAPQLQYRLIPCKSMAMRQVRESGRTVVCVRVRCACQRALRLENRRPPCIAARAVGRELVVVFMESGDAAEVDHGSRFAEGRLAR